MYAGRRANPELLKLVEAAEDRIMIDEVYVGSYSFGAYGFGTEEKSWTDIKGGIYLEHAGEHETR